MTSRARPAQERQRAGQLSGKTKDGKPKRIGEETVSAPKSEQDCGKALEQVAACKVNPSSDAHSGLS